MKTHKRIISILLALVLFLSCTSMAAIAETGDLSDSSSTFQTDPTSGDTKPTATDSPPAEPSQTNAATTDPSPTDPQPTETVSQTEEQQPEEGQRSPSESSPDSTTSITTFVSETPVSETTPETTEPVQSGTEETTLQPDVTESEPTESETTETDPPEEKTFAVTLDSQGGTTFEPLVINEGDPIGQLPVPVKDGFGFDGWSLAIEGKLIDSSFIVNEDITLFAVWDWILVPNNPDGLSGPESVSAFINYSIYPATSFGAATLRRSSASLLSLSPGDVELNKTATPVEGMVNTWDVLLEIKAKDTVTTSDIVLVIDRSGSMRGSKLTNAKNAALEFVDVLLPSTSTRIAVVSFAGEVTTNQVLTNNATDLNSAINGLNANGGTFTQAAMRQAAAILANSTATYKNIVLLSDGEPTYSYGINDPYKMNTANLEPYSRTYFSTAWQTTINTPQEQFNTTTVGSGSSMWHQYDNPSGTSNDKYYNNGHAAVAEAGFYKNEASLKYLYTIALDAGTNGTPILNQMASPGKSYTATESQLEAIFAAIAGEIKAAVKNASIADPMGKGFEVMGDISDVETNSGTVNLTGTGIDWQAGTPPLKAGSTDERYAKLSYRIEINDDILDVPVPADGLYETNGPTVVTYTNSAGSIVSENFPIPTVDPILLIVEKVLKNDSGKIISADDRVFDINITSLEGYKQTYSLKAGQRRVMTNLRLTDQYTVNETGVRGTPISALADYITNVNVYGIDQTTFSINQGSPDSPVIVTNQEKSLGKLTVKKVFDNMPAAGAPTSKMMSLAAEPLVFSFTVTGPGGFEETFDLGSGEERTFEGIKYGTYTVVETTTGYDTTYDPAGGEVTLSIGQKEGTVTVTNRVQSGIDITATKIWDGGPLPYPEVWFRLFRSVNGGTPEPAGVEDKQIASGIDATVNVSWTNLPQYSPEGFSYVYSVQEFVLDGTNFVPGTPAGYYKTEGGLTVTNKWVTGSFTPAVTKALSGRDLAAEEFEFELYKGEDLIETKSNDVDGNVYFSALTYALEDVENSPHVYTIKEVKGTLGGVEYSEEVITLTIDVTDKGDGTLDVAATYSEVDPTITNIYTATGSFAPAIKKVLEGRLLQEGEFEFELYKGEDLIETKSNDVDGNVYFSALTYALEDVENSPHVYTIKEVKGTLGGVEYSEEVITLTIDVTDKGDGTLDVAATYSEVDPTITNIYTATGSFAPAIKKVLEGRLLQEGEFEFELYKGEDLIETKSNDVDGNVYFSALTYALEDVENSPHVYTIKEVKGTLGGVEYSEEVITLTIDVTDKGDGTLDVAATYSEVDPTITNIYTATGSFAPAIKKVLEGRLLQEGEFEFELYKGEDLIETKSNDVDGNVYFSALTYALEDVENSPHVYTIKEVKGTLGGVEYSEEVITLTIDVTDKGDGTLDVAATYSEVDPTITNIYTATGSFTPAVTKVLTGRTLEANEFLFDLAELTAAGPPEVWTPVQPDVGNLANGTIPFTAINYTLADLGVHTYRITEQASGLGGVTDDTLPVTYIVTVTDNGDGTLDVDYDTPADTSFNNNYTAKETTAAISLSKMLTGRALADGEFSFELYNADSEGVLGTLVETVMNVGTAVDFSPITYIDDDLTVEDNSKTYYYIVKETLYTTLGGITYDGDEKKINVVVTDNGLGQMVATVNYPDDTTFNNEYDIKDKTIILTGTKMFTGIKELTDGLFSFEVLEGTTVVATGLNKADGSIDFTPITYKTANIGTHNYLIREVPGTGGGIDYDSQEYEVTVLVADNGDGTLKIDITYPETGAVFTNTYTTEDTSLILEAHKMLTGDKLLEDQEFSFEVFEGTTLVSTGKNVADGKISFAPIVYKESHIGVHNYTVKEVNSGLEGVTYDAHEFAVEVTVVDNGDGTLTATAKYPEGGIHFTNHFTPLPITHNVPVEKRVTGAGAPTDAKFYFELKAITPEAPMPAGAVNGLKTYTMTGAGSFELGLMSFTKEGTYVYELREQPTDAKNFTIDTTLYTITIKITREGYKLVKAAVFTMNNGTEPLEKLVYTNTYKAPPPPIPRTGEQTRSLLLYGLGLLAAALALFAYKKRRDKHHKAL